MQTVSRHDSTLQPPAVAGDQQLLQSHGQAITAALAALLRVQTNIVALASTTTTATMANLDWRVDLLGDVIEEAVSMSVLLEALVAAELDGPGLS